MPLFLDILYIRERQFLKKSMITWQTNKTCS